MSNIPPSQRRRADFLLAVLKLPGVPGVAKKCGIKDHSFIRRLEHNLSEHASLADAPREGRPPKYTTELLGEAWGYMKELDGAWSSSDFVSYLIDMGTLQEGNSVAGFWEAFQAYVHRQGWRLVYGTQRLTFALSTAHAKGRLQWCHDHEREMTSHMVRQYWFVDEILLEYPPAPKCEWERGGALRAPRCCGAWLCHGCCFAGTWRLGRLHGLVLGQCRCHCPSPVWR